MAGSLTRGRAFAAHMTTGLWKPKSNVRLVENAQKALAAAKQVADVAFMHVKGHAGVRGNEEADKLAGRVRLELRAAEVVWRAATDAECRVEFGKPEVLGGSAEKLAKSAERSKRSVKARVGGTRKRSGAKKKV